MDFALACCSRLERKLVAIVNDSAPMMRALVCVRALGLPSWCIGAGALRGLVWDRLHGMTCPTPWADVDVVYFDPAPVSARDEQQHEASLLRAWPQVRWEVVNQAFVHRWARADAEPAPLPFRSLSDAVGSWPETATCVGVWLDDEDRLRVLAPLGLGDLFDQVVRWNPRRVSAHTFRARVAAKRFVDRWPGVRVEWPQEECDERIR